MASTQQLYGNPKKNPRCAFCAKWMGNANPVFINTITGFRFEPNIYATCAKTGSRMLSLTSACKYYEPNADARKLL